MLHIAGRQQLISRIPLRDLEGNLIGAVGKGMLNEVTRLWDLQRKVELLERNADGAPTTRPLEPAPAGEGT